MTQQMLADKMGYSQKKLASLESGLVKSPRTEDLLDFSDFFKISVDSLLRIDLSKLGELKLRELEAGSDVYLTGSNIRVLATMITPDNKDQIEMVTIKV